MAGKARCSQFIRSHRRQVTPTGTAAGFPRSTPSEYTRSPGILDRAADVDGVDRALRVVAAALTAQGARHVEVGRAVRHPRQLHAGHPGRQEGGVDIPERAGAAEAGDPDAGAAEPLRDV